MASLPAKQERAATAAFLRRGSASWLWLGVFLGVVTMLYGCDNTIEPFDEETGLFSIYGYLSLSEETNVIRIRDLNTPLLRDPTRELDAKASLENLDDGTTEQLERSRLEFDGIYVHNFEVTMPVEPETEYQLTVERSDGVQATSTATTPTLGEVTYGPEGEDATPRFGSPSAILTIRSLYPSRSASTSMAINGKCSGTRCAERAIRPFWSSPQKKSPNSSNAMRRWVARRNARLSTTKRSTSTTTTSGRSGSTKTYRGSTKAYRLARWNRWTSMTGSVSSADSVRDRSPLQSTRQKNRPKTTKPARGTGRAILLIQT